MLKRTYKIAFGGVIAALSAVLMFLTGIIPFGTYALPALAGMALVTVVIELGSRFAFAVYAVVSVLSALFVPDKEAAMFFIIFLGFYPILKGIIEGKIRARYAQYIIKLILFNACMVASYFIGKFLLSIPDESFVVFGIFLPYLFLALGNVFFILYDFCITVVVNQYFSRLRGKIFRGK